MTSPPGSAGPDGPGGRPAPGPVARLWLRLLLSERERAEVLGELEELWERRRERDGAARARRWYARELRRYALRLVQYRLLTRRRRRRRRGLTPARASFLEGLAADVRQAARGWAKSPGLAATIVLTVGLGLGASTAMAAVVRTVLLDALPYPDAAVDDVATADRLVDDALAAPRNIAAVVLGFAAVAILLAVIGIYGVMSYFVHERRREIGIRLVLGGRPRRVLRAMVGAGMRPVLAGTAIGLVLAALATRFTERLLFGVAPGDPATLAAVAAGMLVTALVACWVPASRATRLEPGNVLREE